MQNDEGQNMDLYIPRKCFATNRLITSKDHASVQFNLGHLDERGVYTGAFSTFALCGFIRAQGDADSAVDRLWQKKKVETIYMPFLDSLDVESFNRVLALLSCCLVSDAYTTPNESQKQQQIPHREGVKEKIILSQEKSI
ncbi:hypothetical protein ACS0TY_018506 [Phlomoides rotata]